MLHGLARDAGAKKRLKQQAHGLLHLEVWIEHDPSVDIIDETDGQLRTKLSSARLVQKPTAQSGPHHVKLGFTHGALQTEKQPVVEVCRIVDAVLVENERLSEGADFQEPVPVRRIARQP